MVASIYHLLLKKKIVFMTMNCYHQDSKYVAKLWRTFNDLFELEQKSVFARTFYFTRSVRIYFKKLNLKKEKKYILNFNQLKSIQLGSSSSAEHCGMSFMSENYLKFEMIKYFSKYIDSK